MADPQREYDLLERALYRNYQQLFTSSAVEHTIGVALSQMNDPEHRAWLNLLAAGWARSGEERKFHLGIARGIYVRTGDAAMVADIDANLRGDTTALDRGPRPVTAYVNDLRAARSRMDDAAFANHLAIFVRLSLDALNTPATQKALAAFPHDNRLARLEAFTYGNRLLEATKTRAERRGLEPVERFLEALLPEIGNDLVVTPWSLRQPQLAAGIAAFGSYLARRGRHDELASHCDDVAYNGGGRYEAYVDLDHERPPVVVATRLLDEIATGGRVDVEQLVADEELTDFEIAGVLDVLRVLNPRLDLSRMTDYTPDGHVSDDVISMGRTGGALLRAEGRLLNLLGRISSDLEPLAAAPRSRFGPVMDNQLASMPIANLLVESERRGWPPNTRDNIEFVYLLRCGLIGHAAQLVREHKLRPQLAPEIEQLLLNGELIRVAELTRQLQASAPHDQTALTTAMVFALATEDIASMETMLARYSDAGRSDEVHDYWQRIVSERHETKRLVRLSTPEFLAAQWQSGVEIDPMRLCDAWERYGSVNEIKTFYDAHRGADPRIDERAEVFDEYVERCETTVENLELTRLVGESLDRTESFDLVRSKLRLGDARGALQELEEIDTSGLDDSHRALLEACRLNANEWIGSWPEVLQSLRVLASLDQGEHRLGILRELSAKLESIGDSAEQLRVENAIEADTNMLAPARVRLLLQADRYGELFERFDVACHDGDLRYLNTGLIAVRDAGAPDAAVGVFANLSASGALSEDALRRLPTAGADPQFALFADYVRRAAASEAMDPATSARMASYYAQGAADFRMEFDRNWALWQFSRICREHQLKTLLPGWTVEAEFRLLAGGVDVLNRGQDDAFDKALADAALHIDDAGILDFVADRHDVHDPDAAMNLRQAAEGRRAKDRASRDAGVATPQRPESRLIRDTRRNGRDQRGHGLER